MSTLNCTDIPVFILAGGYGTRLTEETTLRPKPMIEIGGIPVLIHIMRYYYAYGFNDFVICAGYKSIDIKNYFLSYQYNFNDVEFDFRDRGEPTCRPLYMSQPEKWRVRVIDTGMDAMTGSRIARAFDIVQHQQSNKFDTFAVTYGDGLTDANLHAELKFHREHGGIGTVLGVKSLARFGEIESNPKDKVIGFLEKPQHKQGFISGGFFLFQNKFRDFLDTKEDCILERGPMAKLAAEGFLHMFRHNGFWYAMDTLRDKNYLQDLWDKNQAPWLMNQTVPR